MEVHILDGEYLFLETHSTGHRVDKHICQMCRETALTNRDWYTTITLLTLIKHSCHNAIELTRIEKPWPRGACRLVDMSRARCSLSETMHASCSDHLKNDSYGNLHGLRQATRHGKDGVGPLKTQYFTACSLDGFIATDDHSLEWLFQLGDIAETGYPDFIREVGALAMGSSTYEIIVQIGSVTLGSGKPLLPRQIAFPPLKLTSVRQCGTGFAELRYEVPRPQKD